jgi:hypothetical protein
MNIYVSGYGEEDILVSQNAEEAHGQLIWLKPEAFFSKAGQSGIDMGHKWIWVYRPPWSLLVDTSLNHTLREDIIRSWPVWQRQAFKLRHTLPNVHLVNIDQTSLDTALAHLGDNGAQRPSTRPTPSDLSLALGKLFAWIDPAQWDVFESLELAAINTGGAPLDRHNLTPPSPEVIREIAHLITAGSALPEKTRQMEELENLIQDKQKAATEYQDTIKKLRASEKKLQEQLAQVTQSLEAVQEKQARLAEENTELRKKQQADTATNAQLKEVSEENELLLLQLHQVQEELEQYFLAHQEMSTSLEKSRETMDKARCLIAGMSE